MPRIIADYKGKARALIVQAGIAAFSKRGYRDTTMEQIAHDVGVTKGDLYHYFPSKAALLREIATTFRGAFLHSLVEGFANVDSAEALTNAVMRTLDRETLATQLWFDLMAESSNDPETERLMRLQNREYLRAVKTALARLEESPRTTAGHVPSDDVPMAIMFLLQGALTNLRLGTPRREIRGALLEGIRSILDR